MLLASIFAAVVLPIALACGGSRADDAPVPPGPPPDSFRVAFETTRGRFVVDVFRPWAPIGVDRFYDLVRIRFFDDDAFFRVVPGFVAQFGVASDPRLNVVWDARPIADDAARTRNARGTVAFAMDGPNTRTHQLFVNLQDNVHLDAQGFAPIGRVVDGMPTVDSIYSGYKDKPSAHMIATLGNSYLERMFPKIDYIKRVRLVR